MAGRIGLAVGGAVALVGSLLAWATFSVLFSFYSRTGLELGYGILSALFAMVSVISGIGARRWTRALSFVGAIGILGAAALAAIVVRWNGPGSPGLEFHRYGLGLLVTVIGGGIALAGAILRARDRTASSSVDP